MIKNSFSLSLRILFPRHDLSMCFEESASSLASMTLTALSNVERQGIGHAPAPALVKTNQNRHVRTADILIHSFFIIYFLCPRRRLLFGVSRQSLGLLSEREVLSIVLRLSTS
jgi:hypothetical protein